MSDPASIQEALAAVMGDLPSISKSDTSGEGYAYRGVEQITRHVQPLLAKHGVVIAPRARITDVRPSPAMKDGWTDVFMEVEWDITGPDGTKIAARTTGIGRDRSDKGANKAQTQAYKYLLLHLLCVADGKDDSDGHTYEHDRTEFISAGRANAIAKKCEESDVDAAELARLVTDGRTQDVGELFVTEVDRVAEVFARLAPKDES